MTNTRHIIACVLDETPMREEDLRAVFKRLHALLVDALCDPFLPGSQVGRLVESAAAITHPLASLLTR